MGNLVIKHKPVFKIKRGFIFFHHEASSGHKDSDAVGGTHTHTPDSVCTCGCLRSLWLSLVTHSWRLPCCQLRGTDLPSDDPHPGSSSSRTVGGGGRLSCIQNGNYCMQILMIWSLKVAICSNANIQSPPSIIPQTGFSGHELKVLRGRTFFGLTQIK